MAVKYLDGTGLAYLWRKICNKFATIVEINKVPRNATGQRLAAEIELGTEILDEIYLRWAHERRDGA